MLKIHFSLAGACLNKLIICDPEKSITLIREPETTLVNEYEEMLKSFQKLSLHPTTEDKLLYIRQRMSCISVWETRMCIRADLVRTREEAIKTRENTISAQEVVIQTLENRSENLLCKVCLQNDSNIIVSPCFHIAMCSSCHMFIPDHCPVCRTAILDSTIVYIT